MHSLIKLGDDAEMKLYFNKDVYSPDFSSIGTILLADKLIKDGGKPDVSVLDVGCGSGIIGLGIKKKNPFSKVVLTDVDKQAVKVAKLNAKRLGMAVNVSEADMLPSLGDFELICANLPTYSDADMQEHKDSLSGPPVAYYAGSPLSLYARLFDEARGRCKALIVECQAKYQEPLLVMAGGEGWTMILSTEYSFAFLPPRAEG